MNAEAEEAGDYMSVVMNFGANEGSKERKQQERQAEMARTRATLAAKQQLVDVLARSVSTQVDRWQQ